MTETSERPSIILVNRCLISQADKLLIIERAENDDHNPKQWEFPGGKLNKGQNVQGALEREVLEETGLIVQLASQIAYWESTVFTEGKYPGATYVALFGMGRVIGGRLQLSHEHSHYEWATYDEALTYDLTSESRNALIALGAAALSGDIQPPT